MKTIVLILALAALLPLPAWATLQVVACEPEWAALASEIGGDRLQASSATTARQDPHRIEARPSLIARVRNADLLICTGLELETGWLPILLQQSGNSRVMPGQPGYLEAGLQVPRLEVHAQVDRSQGDVHSAGNPHIQLDPRNIARVAEALTRRLIELDPAQAAHYRARHEDFARRWQAALERWETRGAPLRGLAVVEHHRNMSYLLHWLGMNSVATLEPKPGVEPSAAHLAHLTRQLQAQPARLVLRAAYQDGRASQWLAEHTGTRAVVLPFTVGGSERARDLFSLFDETLDLLLDAAR